MTDAARIDRFLEHAANAASGAHRVESTEELLGILRRIVPPDLPVYCPGVTEMEKTAAVLFPSRVSEYVSAAVTVEEVFGAVAETGSLVCASSGGKAVQAGLLPAHHVALVGRGKIFETLDDFFATCAQAPPTNVTLVTGPSRTADIELTLAIGVHGPKKVDIIVY